MPKKVMYNTSHVRETLHDAHHFGYKIVVFAVSTAKSVLGLLSGNPPLTGLN